MEFVCDLSQWQHRSLERTNQTESSRGPCGLFIIQENGCSKQFKWWCQHGGGERRRGAGTGGVREEGWMEGKLMYVGRKKNRLPSHHQSDLNMHSFMFNKFICFQKNTNTHTHTFRTQIEDAKPAVLMCECAAGD